MKDLRIDKVISSDLARAHETARIVFRHNSVEKTADLREMNFGLFEGLTHEEIIKKYPTPYEEWINDLERVKTPNGEGLRDLSKRIEDRLSCILSEYRDKTVAIVSHSGPIRIILCEALKLGIEMFWQTEQQLGALNVIEYVAGSPPAVVMRNDVSHLSCEEEVVL